MRLSLTATYAIQAVLRIARAEGKAVPCSELCSEGKLPQRFLLQILRKLVVEDILSSARGVNGGYRLNRAPTTVSLLEIIEAVDGPVKSEVKALNRLPDHAQTKVEAVMGDLEKHMRSELNAIKLTQLIQPGNGHARLETLETREESKSRC